MTFFVKSYELDGIHFLEPHGKMTIGASVREFRTAFESHISDGASCILVNCSQLTFMDSSGIGELVGLNHKSKDADCRLVLCELPNRIRDLFRITQVSRLFSVHETEGEAMRVFQNERARSAVAEAV